MVRPRLRFFCSLALITLVLCSTNSGDELLLKNGMRLHGRHAPLKEMGGNALAIRAPAGQVDVELIRLIDDGLRRTFVSHYQIDAARPEVEPKQGIVIPHQRIARSGRAISSVGQVLEAEPFDQWGRRRVRLMTPLGAIDVVQAITEVTPVYTKIEGFQAERSYVWDMRVATSSIAHDVLGSILREAIDQQNANERLSVVRLYIQSERYEDALDELKRAIGDFPELEDLRRLQTDLRQLSARRLVREITLRRQAGQHQLVRSLLAGFPSQDVAQDILLEAREIALEYDKQLQQVEQVKTLLQAYAAQIDDDAMLRQISPIRQEIAEELNLNNIDRMADLLRLEADQQLGTHQKLSLAISGWLLGRGSAIENLAVSLSLVEVRDWIQEYLRTEPHEKREREAILDRLVGLEGSDPAYVAMLLRLLKPPRDVRSREDPEPQDAAPGPGREAETNGREGGDEEGVPGLHLLRTAGLPGQPDIEYLVQLPPEYDPYRLYPAIVTLYADGTNPAMQIDWWAGSYDKEKKTRMGQAGRHGYIVIAPFWSDPKSHQYGYSTGEHAAVLFSLRDACQRLAIDTDRVFLSGHSMGADAAWDIGLAHPDLWSGVIPIVALAVRDDPNAPRYVTSYWENAKYVPLYFIHGEKDGNKIVLNARQFDRYLQHTGYDTMVVEYIGRGHEHFYDEIHRLMEWMSLHRRSRFPDEFHCASMRPWDSFFWWAELEGLPSRSMVLPLQWPNPKARAVEISGKTPTNTSIVLRAGASRTTVWLTPEMGIDFNQRLTVDVDGEKQRASVTPSTEVLLEDARTRADRLHPFWAKLQFEGRRR